MKDSFIFVSVCSLPRCFSLRRNRCGRGFLTHLGTPSVGFQRNKDALRLRKDLFFGKDPSKESSRRGLHSFSNSKAIRSIA